MNVLLASEESAGIQTLKALARSDHRIVAVMASPMKKSLSGSTLWQVAERIRPPTWPVALVKDPAFAGRIRGAEMDIILNAYSLFVMHGEVEAFGVSISAGDLELEGFRSIASLARFGTRRAGG